MEKIKNIDSARFFDRQQEPHKLSHFYLEGRIEETDGEGKF
jgi:hypothetical protein